MDVPVALRRFLAAHGVVDLAIGLALLLAPHQALASLGWSAVDSTTTRLLGATFAAIGVRSLGARRETSSDKFAALLDLHILWGLLAIVALVIAMGDGAPAATVVLLAHFLAFTGIFIYYRVRMKQLAALTDDVVTAETELSAQPAEDQDADRAKDEDDEPDDDSEPDENGRPN